jgi:hypothetical protein
MGKIATPADFSERVMHYASVGSAESIRISGDDGFWLDIIIFCLF